MTVVVHVTRCPHCNATDSASRRSGSVIFAPTDGGWMDLNICTICDGYWYRPVAYSWDDPDHFPKVITLDPKPWFAADTESNTKHQTLEGDTQ